MEEGPAGGSIPPRSLPPVTALRKKKKTPRGNVTPQSRPLPSSKRLRSSP